MFLRERGHLSLQEKGSVIALHQHGVPVGEIANRFNCHPNTVKRWVRRHDETYDVKRRIGSGRPRKTTAEEDNFLLDAVRVKPLTTATEIAGKYSYIMYNYCSISLNKI
jgi:transposase